MADISTDIHGVAVYIGGIGVLITGDSGTGKTELAIELVNNGHKFIADDLVVIKKTPKNTIVISAPKRSFGIAHIRNLGLINVSKLFSNQFQVIQSEAALDLIINLTKDSKFLNVARSTKIPEYTNILGLEIPTYTVYAGRNRNLGLITELIVKSFRSEQLGINGDIIVNHL